MNIAIDNAQWSVKRGGNTRPIQRRERKERVGG